MTVHAATLPGQPTAGLTCRGEGCYVLIQNIWDGDTPEDWETAMTIGAVAMKAYLAKYGYAHSGSCKFQILPPSVLVKYRSRYELLERERERALRAMAL